MAPRYVRNHRTRGHRLGNNPPLVLVAPPSTANNACDFRVSPNYVRVVTNVDHNVYTIPTRIHDRALLALAQPCGVKAPLTFDPKRS